MIRDFVPDWAVRFYRNCRQRAEIASFAGGYAKVVERVRTQEKIKVAFFLINSSVWKYDELFGLMLRHERFEPVVVICPYLLMGEEVMWRDMAQAEDFVKKKALPYISAYDNGWVDVKRVVNPDIIFYTNPHEGLTRDEYYVRNFPDVLNCYVPYAFISTDTYQMHFNAPMNNLVWRLFIETQIHKKISQQYSASRGRNVVVTGYPGCDAFLNREHRVVDDPWKIGDRSLKRIIWAPHHTIEKDFTALSSFLDNCDFMLNVAQKYRDRVQFVFRPHPLLLPKLYGNGQWGKERTDEYFERWNEMSNSRYYPHGDYVDLFFSSDAMIHDCGSFMTEYLPLNKPVLYTVSSPKVIEGWNDSGRISFNAHYHSYKEQDTIDFIENVVICGNDIMSGARKDVVENHISMEPSTTASERIFNVIVNELS